jgi:hypothetical protein
MWPLPFELKNKRTAFSPLIFKIQRLISHDVIQGKAAHPYAPEKAL